ncbi:glycosyltransferase [Pseudokineococcus basanitobsidens]|uniref:Glycosyltransferase n=1 Tax=Pseudokineococcus basanitobsidens TaxID=1926649 RepID=A0ABU8RFY9_9ACTN
MPDGHEGRRPAGSRVVVWRDELLPSSETFIANQVGAMTRWEPLLAGLYRRPSLLDVDPALVVAGSGRVAGVHRRWVRASGRSRRLDALLRRPGVRVVHAHFGRDGMLVAPAARRAGLPLVVTFHGYDVTRLPEEPGTGPAYRRGLRGLFSQASALVAVSGYVRARLLALGAPPAKVVVLPVGTSLGARPVGREALRRILFAGRLVEVKGVADLLDAVALLPPGLRDVPVDVVGDGPLRAPLEERARALGLDARFHGVLRSDDLAVERARGGVYCGPSHRSSAGDSEGLGMVFLEAAAAGLPVVAYRHGGVPEAVDDGVSGLLAPEGDVPALSAALARVLSDSGLAASMGAAGRRLVEERYDVECCTAALEDLYDRVAAGAGR